MEKKSVDVEVSKSYRMARLISGKGKKRGRRQRKEVGSSDLKKMLRLRQKLSRPGLQGLGDLAAWWWPMRGCQLSIRGHGRFSRPGLNLFLYRCIT